MGALDQITQMKNQGVAENEIVSSLQEQGISPKEINDALNQSKIKSAVSDQGAVTSDMQPSIGPSEAPSDLTPPGPGASRARAQEMGEPRTYAPQVPQQEAYGPPAESPIQEEYYPQDQYATDYGSGGDYGYGGYGEYAPAGTSTDSVIEIAEQVFIEKMKEIQKQLEELNEFKSLAQININQAIERLKRVEATMDKLQLAILDKIGSYGQSLQGIKKEMSMMQDSFGKMVKPIAARAATEHIPRQHKTTIVKKTYTKPKVQKRTTKTVTKRKTISRKK